MMLVFLVCYVYPFLLAANNAGSNVTGVIIEKETGKPLEFAGISVYQTDNNQFITGTVSNAQGRFSLKSLPMGDYYIVYSYLGYGKQNSSTFSINMTKKWLSVDLGKLYLMPSVQQLDEVTVKGKRSIYVQSIDKKIFQVGEDLMSASGSASDIKRVEIITNPSAEYKPDGVSGIINIVMKKQHKADFNSSLIANAGNENCYNTSAALNYNIRKINLFGSYGIRLDTRNRFTSDNRIKKDSLLSYIAQHTYSKVRPLSHIVNGGVDWNINDKNTFQSVYTIDTPQLKQRIEQTRNSRIFYIGLLWNFGSTLKKTKNNLKYDESM